MGFRGVLGAIGVVLSAGAAGATTLLELDVPSLTAHATLIVRGTVQDVRPRVSGDGMRIYTHSRVKVSEVWKGQLSDRELVVVQPGGIAGDWGQYVSGAAQFVSGEEVLLFLAPRGPAFHPVGMAQGKFRLTRSREGGWTATPGSPEELGELLPTPGRQYPSGPVPLGKIRDEVRQIVAPVPGAPAPAAPPLGTRP